MALFRRGNDVEIERKLALIQKELTKLRRALFGPDDVRIELQEPGFLELANSVLREGRTLHGRDRLWILWQAAWNSAATGGAGAEVGAFRGGTAYFIAAALERAVGHEVPVEVIDTFEGHPTEKLTDVDPDPHHSSEIFTETSYESVVAHLAPFGLATVHKGEFSEVAPSLPERQYGLVHIDVDIHQPARDCLHYFGPRMLPGGVIVMDDYESPTSPGIRLAAEEYLAEVGGFQSWNPHTKQLLLIKVAPSPAG
jgi:hypothetical protein